MNITKAYDEQVITTEPAPAAGRPDTQRQDTQSDGPLLPENVAKDFRSRWDTIQAGFVDEPKHAVQQADELVAQSIQQLSSVFTDERNKLEKQWDRGDDVSTEDLRVALQKYRSFFNRLLAV